MILDLLKKITIKDFIIMSCSVAALVIVAKKEFFELEKTYYVDNSQIRALYQDEIKKDILSSTIKTEQDLKDRIKRFDDELENTVNFIAKEYNINIYATRAFYSAGEKVDLSKKALEIMAQKGYTIK
ncbi:MAG: hypothetical protein AABY36_02725 [Campylobacterota bacterium]